MGGDTNLAVVEAYQRKTAHLERFHFKRNPLDLEGRLWAAVVKAEPWECWLWTGGTSAGAKQTVAGLPRTNVRYGLINEGNQDGGSRKRTWRVHLLAKLVGDPQTLIDVPRDLGEELVIWLRRARRHFVDNLGLTASHQCDFSLCCNWRHLEWETHRENLEFQREREKKRRSEPGWVPVCCEKPKEIKS